MEYGIWLLWIVLNYVLEIAYQSRLYTQRKFGCLLGSEERKRKT